MNRRILVPLLALLALAAFFTYGVQADSTVTIPVPENAKGQGVTLSLRIPPNTEPVAQQQLKRVTNRSMVVWDPDPYPKVPAQDEYYEIVRRLSKKGWVKGMAQRQVAGARLTTKYEAVGLIDHLVGNVVQLGMQKDMVKAMRQANITPADIDDLRRLVARFSKELTLSGRKVRDDDKNLLLIADNLKRTRSGMLKVIRVEGQADGATIIHLQVD